MKHKTRPGTDGPALGVVAYSSEGSDELSLHRPTGGKRVSRENFAKLQALMPKATFHEVKFKDYSKKRV